MQSLFNTDHYEFATPLVGDEANRKEQYDHGQ